MLRDFGVMRSRLGVADAIMVVGDIAATGQSSEYSTAEGFLELAADVAGCTASNVVCVPGNHDVDWGAQTQARDAIQYKLRHIPTRDISDMLLSLLRDPGESDILLKPLEAYNAFALAYGCDIGPDHPVFPAKTFQLGDRKVQVHGITSVWTSDGTDSPDADERKLVAGLFQLAPVLTDPDSVAITLCHHPPRWVRDTGELAGWFSRAQLVLTGHEHEAGITQSDDGRTLYVASGAVNPYRGEDGWIPAYNVIELDEPEPGVLAVSVYTRTWQFNPVGFGPAPDHPDPMTFTLPIGPSPTTSEVDELVAAEYKALATQIDVSRSESAGSSSRAYIHTVMRSAPDRRHREARTLGLLADDPIDGLAADRELLANAIRDDRLPDLAARLMEG